MILLSMSEVKGHNSCVLNYVQ